MIGDFVVLGLGLVLFAALGRPNLMVFLKLLLPGKMQTDFESGPEGLAEFANNTAVQKRLEDMKALGFSPLGIQREWQAGRPAVRGISLASREVKGFASIHSFDNPRIYFYTPFVGGAIVLTSDLARNPIETDNVIHGGLDRADPAAVFEYHQKRVKEMIARGRSPYTSFTPEDRLNATRAYYAAPEIKGLVRGLMGQALVTVLVCLGVIAYGCFRLWWRFR